MTRLARWSENAPGQVEPIGRLLRRFGDADIRGVTTFPLTPSLMRHARCTLADLARPAQTVQASSTCGEAEDLFRRTGAASLVVVEGRSVGLLARTVVERTLAGSYGYGRSLIHQQSVAPLADWAPLVLDQHASVAQAATVLLARGPSANQVDDVLLRCPDRQWALVGTSSLLQVMTAQFAHRAAHDGLTGLANRELFFDRLQEMCAQGPGAVAVLFVDLDRFKAVNDARGHNAGDGLLTGVAARLRDQCRPEDVVARLGGDEFAVVLRLPCGGLAAARAAAEKVCAGVRAAVPAGCGVTASVGVAVAAPGNAEPHTLVREADLAMYEAKAAGGDRVVMAGWVGMALAPDAPLRAGGLASALDRHELRLHYQPIVSAASGELVAVEALICWQHPVDGLLGPHRFLAGADSATATAVDRWVLRRACLDMIAWMTHPDPVVAGRAPERMNVNLGLATLVDPDLAALILAVLRATGLEPRRLHLELPETADLDCLSAAADQLKQLRAAGVGLALDDVGASTSASWRLGRVGVDEMKVDETVVANLVDGTVEQAVMRMLVTLSGEIGAILTAEGVETLQQLELLRSYGVGAAQGFYISGPLSLAELHSWAASPPRLPDVPPLPID